MPLNSSPVRTCTETQGTSEALVSAIFSTNTHAYACLTQLTLATTEVNNPKARVSF